MKAKLRWALTFASISGWLASEGRLFLHVFAHRRFAYSYERDGDDDWMARHFFTGGMMPADGLAPSLSEHLVVEERFQVEGTHYARTAAAWLANMDAHRPEIEALFTRTYGDQAKKFWHYWRVFFMSCEELWAFDSGREWLVSHYRFRAARAVA